MIIGHGIEDDFDVSRLIGASLTSIRFDHHQLQLHFDTSLMVYIESDFRIVLPSGTDEIVEEIPAGASLAGALLSMVITRATV